MVSGAEAADQGKEQAKVHVRKATAAYNLGKYADAAKEYEAAYEQTLDPNLLFNVGQAYRLAGDRDKAIMAYRSFIRSAPDSERRALAETKIHELEQQRPTAAPAAGPPAGAPSPASAPPVATPPPPTPIEPPPLPPSTGPAAGGLGAPLVAPEPAQPSPFYKRWPFWTGVGVVVAGGVVLGVVLSRHGNDVTLPGSTYGTKEF